MPASGAEYTGKNTHLNALWGVTWGGTDIPTNYSAYREFDHNGNLIRLAMRAHGRTQGSVSYSNSVTADPSSPIYYVETGSFGPLKPAYAKWNFDFYVSIQSNWADYYVKLEYDSNPGVGTDEQLHGYMLVNYSDALSLNEPLNQNSWNLGMGFLYQDHPSNSLQPWTIVKPSSTFNFNVNGEYTFRLSVYVGDPTSGGQPLGYYDDQNNFVPVSVSMKVNAVPGPTSMVALAGLGLVGAGFGVLRRRKRTSA